MLKYLIEFGSDIPDQDIFNYQDLDIIDLENLQGQINMCRNKQRKLLDLQDSLQKDLIMYNKRLSKKTLEISSKATNTRDRNSLLLENEEIVELKDTIEGVKMSMQTVLRELDFVKTDLYILRGSMYQR